MPQLPAPVSPPAPPAPAAPIPGADAFQTPTRPALPRELEAIREQRGELSNQLISAAERRKDLAEELRSASGSVDRGGLEERISVLDKRIVQLETDIATTGRILTTGQIPIHEGSTSVPPVPFDLSPKQVTGISVVFILAVLFPLAIATARRIWRRAPKGASAPEMREIATKLEGLQQAVDTVAIEIERVSEGQRFVTRIMAEGDKALGGGTRAAEPLRVRRSE